LGLSFEFKIWFKFGVEVMGVAFGYRFWVQVQCFRPCNRDQHTLTQVYHLYHWTNSTNLVRLMAK